MTQKALEKMHLAGRFLHCVLSTVIRTKIYFRKARDNAFKRNRKRAAFAQQLRATSAHLRTAKPGEHGGATQIHMGKETSNLALRTERRAIIMITRQYQARSSLQQSRNVRGRKIHPSTGSRRGATAAVHGGPSWGFKGLTKHYWNSVDTQLLFIPERGLTRVETILGLNQYSRQSTQSEPVTCDR